jgi:hypothetical protein
VRPFQRRPGVWFRFVRGMSFRERASERAAARANSSPGRDASRSLSGAGGSLGGVSYRQTAGARPPSPSRSLSSAGRAGSPSRSLGGASRTLSPRRSVREQLASAGRLSPGRGQQASATSQAGSGSLAGRVASRFATSPGRFDGVRSERLSPARSSPGRSFASPSRTSSGRFAAAQASISRPSGFAPSAPSRDTGVNVEQWSSEDVLGWLGRIGLGQYVEAFAASVVDGATLGDVAQMSDGALAEKFGVADEFDVRRLRRELKGVVMAGGPGSAAASERSAQHLEPSVSANDSHASGAASEVKAARAAKRELLRVDGEWEMHFQVLLREKDALDAKLRESEARRATLEAENAALRSATEAGNAISVTQVESFKTVAEGKLQLESKVARLEEDVRRSAEDRREDKQRIASFAEDKAQRAGELKQLQQRLRDKEEEVKGLAQNLTDMTLNQELVKARAETVDEEKLRMERKLESKEQDCSQLEKDLHGVKAQLRTQQLEYEAREEKIREMYEDALDEKEECEIRTKEHELKVFLLEEQLRADGQMPLTHLPEALTPDNSVRNKAPCFAIFLT